LLEGECFKKLKIINLKTIKEQLTKLAPSQKAADISVPDGPNMSEVVRKDVPRLEGSVKPKLPKLQKIWER